MKALEIFASWVVGVGEWVLTVLHKTPSFTAMYLLTIYGMHDSILEFMTSGWCVADTGINRANCGSGLVFFAFMAFGLLAITVCADYNRLEK